MLISIYVIIFFLKKDNNSENFISIMKFNVRVMYYQDFELEFMAFLNKLCGLFIAFLINFMVFTL